MSFLSRINDGLQNVVANLGTGRDKAASTFYVDRMVSAPDLLAMYSNSWVAAAIVDYPAEDAVRKWRAWRGDQDEINAVEALEERLYVQKVTLEAYISSRLFGGSAIYINTKSADQLSPLTPGEEIVSLVVLGCDELTPGPISRDINSGHYGWPEYFTIRTGAAQKVEQVKIHTSRFCIFGGRKIPAGGKMWTSGSFWGESCLKAAIDPVLNHGGTVANIASLVYEAKVDVFKFANFAEILAQNSQESDAAITRRLQCQAAMKGINGAVVIDADDDYEQKSASFSSLPELIGKFQEEVAGAAKIPVTRLFGRSVSGLSGSGDGDERAYYDRINHDQTSKIAPALALLDKCIIAQATGKKDGGVYYEWLPLRQVTESERADNFSKTAAAARALAGQDAGSLIPTDALSDALCNELMEIGVLPGLDQALERYGTLGEQESMVRGSDDDD